MKRLRLVQSEVRYWVERVTPESVVTAMGIPLRFRWEGRRSWNEWTPTEAYLVKLMHGPLLELGSAAAVRVVKPPVAGTTQHAVEAAAHEYLRSLVAARDKFVRRLWRRLAPFAC